MLLKLVSQKNGAVLVGKHAQDHMMPVPVRDLIMKYLEIKKDLTEIKGKTILISPDRVRNFIQSTLDVQYSQVTASDLLTWRLHGFDEETEYAKYLELRDRRDTLNEVLSDVLEKGVIYVLEKDVYLFASWDNSALILAPGDVFREGVRRVTPWNVQRQTDNVQD